MDDAAPFGTYAPRGTAARLIGITRGLGATWLARRATIVLRRLAMRRLRGRPADVEALGFRLRAEPYANICEKRMLFSPQSFDTIELGHLAERIGPGFVFLDIGANIGAYSLFVAARADDTARIVAVEPQPDIFARLGYNIAANGFRTITALNRALADRAGELTLFLDDRNAGGSSVKTVGSGGAASIRVPAGTLLGLAEELGLTRIDAMKLDIEGAEDLVLEPFLTGAPASLRPGLLIIENGAERWGSDIEALLTRCGYTVLARTRQNLVFGRSGTGGEEHG